MIGPGNTLEAFFKLNDQISAPLRRVRAEAQRTERQVKDLSGEVADLERKLKILGKSKATPEVRLNMRRFQYQKEIAEAELKKLSRDRTVVIDVKAKTAAARAELAKMYAEQRLLSSMFGKSSPTLGFAAIGTTGLVALIPIISAAIPLASQLGIALGGLLPIVGALGVGFGLALAAGIPFFKQTIEGWKEIKKAEEAVKNAKTLEERQKATEALRAAEEKLSPVQRDLIRQTRALGAEWKKASAPLQEAVGNLALAGVSTGRSLTKNLGGELKPYAKLFSRQGQAISDFFGSPKQIDTMRKLMRGFLPILESVGSSFGNIFRLIQALTLAAIPLGRWMSKWFEAMTGSAANRAENNIQGLREAFVGTIPTLKMVGALVRDLWNALGRIGGSIDLSSVVNALRIAAGYLEQFAVGANEVFGPRLEHTIRNVGELLLNFIVPFKEVTGFMIDSLNLIIDLYLKLPGPIRHATGVLVGFALVFKTLGIASFVAAGMRTLLAVIFSMIPAVRGLTASFIALNASNPVGWIALAVVGATALTFALYKLFSQTNSAETAEQRFQRALNQTTAYANNATASVNRLRDARFKLEHSEINYERAKLQLDRAVERRNSTKAGTRDRREADLDVREAQIGVQEAARDRARSRSAAGKQARRTVLDSDVFGVALRIREEQANLARLQGLRGTSKLPAVNKDYERQIEASRARLEALAKAFQKSAKASGTTRSEIDLMIKALQKGGPDAQKIIERLTKLGKIPPDLRNYSKTLASVLADSKLTVEEKVAAINLILGGAVPSPDTNEWSATLLGAIAGVQVAASSLQTTLSNIVTNFANAQTGGTTKKNSPFYFIDRNATGGIITSKTISSLAENGAEAVVPLGPGYKQQRNSVLRQIGAKVGGMGGGSALVAINGPINISNGDDMESFMGRLEESVSRALANSPHAMAGELTA